MTYYCGTILDVSGSMQCNFKTHSDAEGGKWVRALFDVIDDFITYDVTSRNKVFAIGAGAKRMPNEAFDVIKTIEFTQNEESSDLSSAPASFSTIDEVFNLLEANGAKHIRKWAEKNIVSQEATEGEAKLLLNRLRKDEYFTKTFVNKYLPSSCRDWVEPTDNSISGNILYQFQRVSSSVVSTFKQATNEDVKRVVDQSVSHLLRVGRDAVYTADKAAEILRGTDRTKKKISPERSEEIHKKIKPYIYDVTPLYSALNEAVKCFPEDKVDGKYLFVFSDGVPSDYGSVTIKDRLEEKGVTIIGCYISTTTESSIKARRLYSIPDCNWETGARFQFDISSNIPSDIIPRVILSHTGWDLDIENDETRLFLHVNSPENMKSAIEALKKAVTSQDCLIDLLAQVPIEIYIKERNDDFKVPTQKGKTCYANAAATVMHLAMLRIHGRDEGYPEFETLRKEIIDESDDDNEGEYTLDVLEKVCPKYRLKYKLVDRDGALKAVSEKRPVIARFELNEDEWDKFNTFFRNSPFGTLSKQDIDVYSTSSDKIGHAVVLTGYSSTDLRLMNFNGVEWGSNGFFKIENAEVLGLEFIDVFWTKEMLSKREHEQYRFYGTSVADRLVKNCEGIKNGSYTCPLCKKESKVKRFYGNLSEVECPECLGKFKSSDGHGNIIAMNIYLTSLYN